MANKIGKDDKRKQLVPPDDSAAEVITPQTTRSYKATPALEKQLRKARNSRELDCPPDFFTEP